MKEPNGYLYPFEAAFWALMAALANDPLETIGNCVLAMVTAVVFTGAMVFFTVAIFAFVRAAL